MSIGPRIIEISLLQALIWNLKVKFIRVVIGQGNAVSPVSIFFALHQFDQQLGPSALAVPGQLSNGGGKNVGHSPAESGTDFWALCTTSATLWPL